MIKLRDKSDYSPSWRMLVKTYGSEAAIRKEYRRLQAAIDKRATRAEQAGFGESFQVKEMRSIVRISEIKDNQQLARLMVKAYKQLSNNKYSIKYIKRAPARRLQKMQARGAVPVLPEEIDMDESLDILYAVARSRGYLKQFGSDWPAEIISERAEDGKKLPTTERGWSRVLAAAAKRFSAFEV